jgi:hypothetical protein
MAVPKLAKQNHLICGAPFQSRPANIRQFFQDILIIFTLNLLGFLLEKLQGFMRFHESL